MKPLCFIGARGGSKGVRRKNTRIIGGRPLVAHAIRRSIDSGIFSHVVVSTEDPQIARIARREGAEVPFMRPKRLAGDSASMIDVMVHGIRELESLGYEFDIFVNRDCTVPFTTDADIRRSIRILRRTGCDLVVTVYRQHHNPYFDVVEAGRGGFLRVVAGRGGITARQSAPAVYQLTGLYTYDKEKFMRYKRGLLPRTLPCETTLETGLMIDTEFEFEVARLFFRHGLPRRPPAARRGAGSRRAGRRPARKR
ncbi:MAG: acylneuraminate cytidylyltransferase family protein [Nitrosopumilus sp.]|nr:acylneuraminate cytidylyltransferase family protein [Nitrosopumilus sp.]